MSVKRLKRETTDGVIDYMSNFQSESLSRSELKELTIIHEYPFGLKHEWVFDTISYKVVFSFLDHRILCQVSLTLGKAFTYRQLGIELTVKYIRTAVYDILKNELPKMMAEVIKHV